MPPEGQRLEAILLSLESAVAAEAWDDAVGLFASADDALADLERAPAAIPPSVTARLQGVHARIQDDLLRRRRSLVDEMARLARAQREGRAIGAGATGGALDFSG